MLGGSINNVLLGQRMPDCYFILYVFQNYLKGIARKLSMIGYIIFFVYDLYLEYFYFYNYKN